MKKLLFLALSISVTLFSCGSDQQADNTQFVVDTESTANRGEPKMTEQQQLALAIDAHIGEEINSGVTHKKVFPGYEFGMKEKQIDRSNRRLSRKGAAKKFKKAEKYSYAYAYLMPVLGDDIPAFIDFSYNTDGKMFKGTGKMDVPEGSSSSDVLNVTKDLFTEWFGAADFDIEDHNYCSRHIWINGNRFIDLRCEVDGIVFSFYNLKEETPNIFETSEPSDEDNPLLPAEDNDDNEQNIQMSY